MIKSVHIPSMTYQTRYVRISMSKLSFPIELDDVLFAFNGDDLIAWLSVVFFTSETVFAKVLSFNFDGE